MEQVNKRHIDLYNQNLGTDNISVDKISKFTLPAILLKPRTLTVKDAELLAKVLDLRFGDYGLFIEFNGKILNPGRIYFNLENYLKITNALTDVTVIKITENQGKTVTETVTLEEMTCEMIVGEGQLREYPDKHKEFIEKHYSRYKQLIVDNYYLNPYRLSQAEIDEYKEKYGDEFSMENCRIPGLFYDFVNKHKEEFAEYLK